MLQYARKKFPHVSFERVRAAPAWRSSRSLARDKKRVAATVDTVEIVERAHAGDALALETVECFCGILGAFAGSVALTLGALGGVYIGGGVALKLGELFTRSSFRARFEAKGRFTHYLENIPTYLITAEYPAFLGVSAILAEQLSNRSGGASSAVFERIRQMRDALTPAERRVADLALNHPRSIINDPIVDIARKADVSQPTVIRFCRSLGCQGLSDFKLKLATGLTGTIPMSHSQVHLGDTATDFGAKVLDNTVSAILQLREHLNFEHVENAIEILNGARRIEFYGPATRTSSRRTRITSSSASGSRRSRTATCSHAGRIGRAARQGRRDRRGVEVGRARARSLRACSTSRCRREGDRDHVEQHAAREARDRRARNRPHRDARVATVDDLADPASADDRHPRGRRRDPPRRRTANCRGRRSGEGTRER